MSGRTCVVTGANSGIGKEISCRLASRGARVVMVARDALRGEAARAEVVDRSGNDRVELLVCDLASQRQVRELASKVLEKCEQLDVLVNNAGLTLGEYHLTEDGIEMTFAVNHLAPFLLTNLLLDRLQASAPARVVTVASDAHRGNVIDFEDVSATRGYSSWRAYGASKLANILFTSELARRLEATGVTATCLHPGVVRTGFGRQGPLFIRLWFRLMGQFLLKPEKGADTAVWLASSPEVDGASGGYYEKRKLRQPSKAARDHGSATRLWDLSRQLTGLERG
ncbi:MAG: SDR family oxidoreductase [Thermoanaerobaculales bacterium]|nr:SDR family oxidoreductase [Thermoanaerobaculales bacterium]